MTDTVAAPADVVDDDRVLAATRAWLEKAVIGLNLCPFARAVYTSGRIRFRVSQARSADALLADLADELRLLAATDPAVTDTTLLVHPHVLSDFLDYNDFLDVVDAALEALDLGDTLQVASFHPHYQFAGTEPDDISNYTNRAPFPTLHLLRQDSVERAVAAIPEPASIFDANIKALRALGLEGWRRLMADESDSAGPATGA